MNFFSMKIKSFLTIAILASALNVIAQDIDALLE